MSQLRFLTLGSTQHSCLVGGQGCCRCPLLGPTIWPPCHRLSRGLRMRLGRLTVKLGPRYDMDGLLPSEGEGWKIAVSGKDFCVWEKASAEAPSAEGASK